MWVASFENMTQTPESGAEPTTVTEQPRHDRSDGPSRLSQLLAWTGIIAGVVFVVAVIFFSGLFLACPQTTTMAGTRAITAAVTVPAR